MPQIQSAIIGDKNGGVEFSFEAAVAEPIDDIVLVRNKAVAVNPVDTKMMGPFVTPGAIAGSDFAGVVEQAGPGAAQHNIKPGDRVCGVLLGMNPLEPKLGAFAELVGAHAADLLHLPDDTSFETAAGMPMGMMTAGLGLFKSLDVPGYPLKSQGGDTNGKKPPATVLVYGGSSATGTAAIQLLKLSGLHIITTCSPKNYALVKSYGAAAAFDYHDPECAAHIRAATKNSLRYVLDCISTTQSMKLCYAAIGRSGGKYTSLEPFSEGIAATRKLVKADWILTPALYGRPIGWPAPYDLPVIPEMVEFNGKWTATLQDLMRRGLLRPHPQVVRSGGIKGILQGMEDVKAGKVSGKKLIFPL